MTRELDTSKGNPVERKITHLSREMRGEFPSVVYQQKGKEVSPFLYGSYMAMKNAQFPLVVAVEKDKSEEYLTIRTSVTERHESTIQSALILGLSQATQRRVEAEGEEESSQRSEEIATALLTDLVSNDELFEEFREYYGGLRWSPDQRRFINTLFTHGTDYNQELLDRHLTSSHISELVYSLKLDIPYETRKDWHLLKPKEIFERYPELDYDRLVDEAFCETEEGKKFRKAYARIGGRILAERHNQPERLVSDEGERHLRPQIPLSRHPIIEELVVNEIATERPKSKYSFAPNEVVELIVESDSIPAHGALVSWLTRRLPVEERHVFDGPDEFQQKGHFVRNILRTYQDVEQDSARQNVLKYDMVAILAAYTGDGAIARDVRKATEKGDNFYVSKDIQHVKDIVSAMLTVSLASSDVELRAQAEGIISDAMDTNYEDPLSLTKGELIMTLLDSLNIISEASHPALYGQVGALVFGDPVYGNFIREIASIKVEAEKARHQPDVLKKFAKWIKSKDNSPEKEQAKKAYEDACKPVEEFSSLATDAKNAFNMQLLEQMLDAQVDISQFPEATKLFDGLVKRVVISSYKMEELPDAYHDLMIIAEHPLLPEKQRGTILWHIAESLKYTDQGKGHLLVPVVLDMYKASLGPVDNLRVPSEETSLNLAAVSHLAAENRHMFQNVSVDDLDILAQYKQAVSRKAEYIFNDDLAIDSGKPALEKEDHTSEVQTLRNFENVAHELATIENYYAEYLHMEDVKRKPHVYYPWVLSSMREFLRGLQYEVTPENRPAQNIQQLYTTVNTYVRNRFIFLDEYPEDFDVMGRGHLDSFLKLCHDSMIVYSDLHYNTTVWQKGIPFVNQSIRTMPDVLLAEMIKKYPGTEFEKYLKNEQKRRIK